MYVQQCCSEHFITEEEAGKNKEVLHRGDTTQRSRACVVQLQGSCSTHVACCILLTLLLHALFTPDITAATASCADLLVLASPRDLNPPKASLCTGTKTVNDEHLSLSGCHVSDTWSDAAANPCLAVHGCENASCCRSSLTIAARGHYTKISHPHVDLSPSCIHSLPCDQTDCCKGSLA